MAVEAWWVITHPTQFARFRRCLQQFRPVRSRAGAEEGEVAYGRGACLFGCDAVEFRIGIWIERGKVLDNLWRDHPVVGDADQVQPSGETGEVRLWQFRAPLRPVQVAVPAPFAPLVEGWGGCRVGCAKEAA